MKKEEPTMKPREFGIKKYNSTSTQTSKSPEKQYEGFRESQAA